MRAVLIGRWCFSSADSEGKAVELSSTDRRGRLPPHGLFSLAVLTDICRAKMEANRPSRKFGYLRSSSNVQKY
jgi:hypothetical protein